MSMVEVVALAGSISFLPLLIQTGPEGPRLKGVSMIPCLLDCPRGSLHTTILLLVAASVMPQCRSRGSRTPASAREPTGIGRASALLVLIALLGCSPGSFDGSLWPQSPSTDDGLCQTGALGWTVEAFDPKHPASPAYLALPEIEMQVGETLGLSVQTVVFGCKLAPHTASYSSSKPDVAKVSETGEGWCIKGIAPGTAEVTARIRGDDGQSATTPPKLFRIVR
jgi:hypothetical protein